MSRFLNEKNQRLEGKAHINPKVADVCSLWRSWENLRNLIGE